MRARRHAILLAALVALAFAPTSRAMPPGSHAAQGMIESVDHAAKTFVIKATKERQPRQFVWKEYTSFRKDGAKAAPVDLRAGVEAP